MNAYRQIWSVLRPLCGEREARAVAFLLLEEAFGVTRTDVYADRIRAFSAAEQRLFEESLRRLAAGEPVQYVLGRSSFCGLRLKVSPAVLIPRPETEDLVAWVLGDRPGSLLDVGTGSGCIAIALKHFLPAARVEAWDVQADALAVAWENAGALGVEVGFRQVDLLALGGADRIDADRIIVSNPPYVCHREKAGMQAQVLDYEPHRALFVPDEDPLLFYRALARLARESQAKALYVETNRAYAEATACLFRDSGFRTVEVRADRFGNDRFVRALR